nr:MAG TPA: hypothetical protein [Caudoviricetes sp.]
MSVLGSYYFRGFSRIECLLLLNSRGLDLWKSFLSRHSSRLIRLD